MEYTNNPNLLYRYQFVNHGIPPYKVKLSLQRSLTCRSHSISRSLERKTPRMEELLRLSLLFIYYIKQFYTIYDTPFILFCYLVSSNLYTSTSFFLCQKLKFILLVLSEIILLIYTLFLPFPYFLDRDVYTSFVRTLSCLCYVYRIPPSYEAHKFGVLSPVSPTLCHLYLLVHFSITVLHPWTSYNIRNRQDLVTISLQGILLPSREKKVF